MSGEASTRAGETKRRVGGGGEIEGECASLGVQEEVRIGSQGERKWGQGKGEEGGTSAGCAERRWGRLDGKGREKRGGGGWLTYQVENTCGHESGESALEGGCLEAMRQDEGGGGALQS